MNARTHPFAFRKPDATLAFASNEAGGSRKGTTTALLKALSIHEGDSDLGLLAEAFLLAGDFYQRNSEELDMAADAAGQIPCLAESIAAEWDAQIANEMEAS